MRRSALPAAVAAVVVLALGASACGGGGSEELSDRPNNTAADGPLPTAPNGKPRNANDLGASATGNVDVNDLIRRIDALNQETDLCTLLTGSAMADVTGANINLTSLISNPAGFTQLFSALDRLFGHMVQIAPADAQAPITKMQGVWSGLATLDLSAAGAQQQASSLIASPDVQAAQSALGVWVQSNCR